MSSLTKNQLKRIARVWAGVNLAGVVGNGIGSEALDQDELAYVLTHVKLIGERLVGEEPVKHTLDDIVLALYPDTQVNANLASSPLTWTATARDAEYIASLLPVHYQVRFDSNGVACRSTTGMPAHSLLDKYEQPWHQFVQALQGYFMDRLAQIYNSSLPHHQQFTIVLTA
jgi:hypothetical protein